MNGPNDRLRSEVAQVLDDVGQLIRRMAEAQGAHRRLTASGSAEGGRIIARADASGALTEVEFARGIEDLGYGRIARGTVRAAQQAAAEAQRETEALLAPLRAAQARLPRVADLAGPDFGDGRWQDDVPPPPPALLTPPRLREPGAAEPAEVRAGSEGSAERAAAITLLQRRRAELYASGAAQGRRVLVAVNADGVLIDLMFSPAIGDLDHDEIAEAIAAATRAAVREVARLVTELFAPITGDRPGYPGAEAALAELGRFRDQLR